MDVKIFCKNNAATASIAENCWPSFHQMETGDIGNNWEKILSTYRKFEQTVSRPHYWKGAKVRVWPLRILRSTRSESGFSRGLAKETGIFSRNWGAGARLLNMRRFCGDEQIRVPKQKDPFSARVWLSISGWKWRYNVSTYREKKNCCQRLRDD